MNMQNKFKIVIVFMGCLLLRLIPFRAPNIEPIMASIMPFGKKYGAIAGFFFGFLSIVLYDLMTNFGSWTLITAFAYGIVGLVSTFYFKKYKTKPINFAIFAFMGTIFFDVVTGILVAPFYGQTMWSAFILQIPFTALHLAGNIAFALTISPALNYFFEKEFNFNLNKKSVLLKS